MDAGLNAAEAWYRKHQAPVDSTTGSVESPVRQKIRELRELLETAVDPMCHALKPSPYRRPRGKPQETWLPRVRTKLKEAGCTRELSRWLLAKARRSRAHHRH